MKYFFIVLIAMLASAQDPQFDPQDRIEQAHKPLIEPKTKPSKQASDLTAEFAKTRATALPKSRVQRKNFIDQQIFGRMERDKIPYAALASDEEFARRAWLDATGRIPQAEELIAFLNDKDTKKRDKLVDRLVASDAFVDRWTFYFEDLFRAGGRMGAGLNLIYVYPILIHLKALKIFLIPFVGPL